MSQCASAHMVHNFIPCSIIPTLPAATRDGELEHSSAPEKKLLLFLEHLPCGCRVPHHGAGGTQLHCCQGKRCSYSHSSGFADTYGEVESCRQGERMDEGFASRKEAPREGLVRSVPWSCRSVVPLRCMSIAIIENRPGRFQELYNPFPCPKA